MMKQGGNGQLQDFLQKLRINITPQLDAYVSHVADRYRLLLKDRVSKIVAGEIPSEPYRKNVVSDSRVVLGTPNVSVLNSAHKLHNNTIQSIITPSTSSDPNANSIQSVQQSNISLPPAAKIAITFEESSLGMTLVKDSRDCAVVSKLVVGGQGQLKGVHIGDVVVSVADQEMRKFSDILNSIKSSIRPLNISFIRVASAHNSPAMAPKLVPIIADGQLVADTGQLESSAIKLIVPPSHTKIGKEVSPKQSHHRNKLSVTLTVADKTTAAFLPLVARDALSQYSSPRGDTGGQSSARSSNSAGTARRRSITSQTGPTDGIASRTMSPYITPRKHSILNGVDSSTIFTPESDETGREPLSAMQEESLPLSLPPVVPSMSRTQSGSETAILTGIEDAVTNIDSNSGLISLQVPDEFRTDETSETAYLSVESQNKNVTHVVTNNLGILTESISIQQPLSRSHTSTCRLQLDTDMTIRSPVLIKRISTVINGKSVSNNDELMMMNDDRSSSDSDSESPQPRSPSDCTRIAARPRSQQFRVRDQVNIDDNDDDTVSVDEDMGHKDDFIFDQVHSTHDAGIDYLCYTGPDDLLEYSFEEDEGCGFANNELPKLEVTVLSASASQEILFNPSINQRAVSYDIVEALGLNRENDIKALQDAIVSDSDALGETGGSNVATTYLEVGMRIKVWHITYRGWKSATIRHIHRNNTLKVQFRNGDIEKYVPLERIGLTSISRVPSAENQMAENDLDTYLEENISTQQGKEDKLNSSTVSDVDEMIRRGRSRNGSVDIKPSYFESSIAPTTTIDNSITKDNYHNIAKDFRVTFQYTPMGLTLEGGQDIGGFTTIIVSRVAVGGQASQLGVVAQDTLIGVGSEWVNELSYAMLAIRTSGYPVSLVFRRSHLKAMLLKTIT